MAGHIAIRTPARHLSPRFFGFGIRPAAFRSLAALLLLARLTVAAGAEPLSVERAVDVIQHWDDNQHLYVKGDLGVAAAQLDALELWLDTHAPHWVVVLCQDAGNERFVDADGTEYSGMDAVDHALGKGLPNRTEFGRWTHPQTGEPDAAFFVLFLTERKFTYYASTAQDRRGLGEKNWIGKLDRPAKAAMRDGGRIVDAVKDTISDIDGKLATRIRAEESARRQREAEQKAELQRARARAAEALAAAAKAIATLESRIEERTGSQPALQGDIFSPPVTAMNAELAISKAAFDREAFEDAAKGATRVAASAGVALERIEKHRNAGAKIEALKNRFDTLSGTPHADTDAEGISRWLSSIERNLSNATDAHRRGDSAYAENLAAAEAGLLSADRWLEQAARSARRLERLKIAAGSGGVLLFLLIGWGLNRRRKPAMILAEKLHGKWDAALTEKCSALVELLDRVTDTLGQSAEQAADRWSGRTLRLAREIIRAVDELFIMSTCATRILDRAERLILPRQRHRALANHFTRARYDEAIRLLQDHPIRFAPGDSIEWVIRGKKTPRDNLVGDLKSYQPFQMTFTELIDGFHQRATRAWTGLETFDRCLLDAGPNLAKLQSRLDALGTEEEPLESAAAEDGLFTIDPLFTDGLPAAAEMLGQARATEFDDPVGTVQDLGGELEQILQRASNLAADARQCREQIDGPLRERAAELSAAGLSMNWIREFIQDTSARASSRAADLAADAGNAKTATGRRDDRSADETDARNPETPAIDLPALADSLRALDQRATAALELERRRIEELIPRPAEAEARVRETREALGKELNLSPDILLREAGNDPDEVLVRVAEQIAAMKAALDLGAIATARPCLESALTNTDAAFNIIETTRSEAAAHDERVEGRRGESRTIRSRVEVHRKILETLRSGFAPEALRIDAADPEFPDSDGSVENNVDSALELLAEADRRLGDAGDAFRRAAILEAARMLDEIESLQKRAAIRLREIELKRDQIESLTQENDKGMKALRARQADLAGSLDDPRTTDPTRQRARRMEARIEEVERMISTRPANPFEIRTRLEELRREIQALADASENDRASHAEAERSLTVAGQSVDAALALADRAARDRITDSPEITRARSELHALAADLEAVRDRFAHPHQDWTAIDRDADRIENAAARAASTLRGELHAAERALAAVAAALESIREASSWSGHHGIRVTGRPGSRRLDEARALLQSGEYRGCVGAAETARNQALTAMARARMEADRRRREEERRAEERRRRRARAEARRRLRSTGSTRSSSFGSSSGFGGSRSGFSSGSGTSRSSFSGGSGTSRSGW